MNFAGYVPKRRAVLEHLISHKLSLNEYVAFDILLLKADSNTGCGLINAPILCFLSGYSFNLDTAERLLNALHDSGYIWYRARRGSKQPQPYWINRYVLTRGPYKMRRINLTQLFEKSTISQQEVFDRADHPTDQVADHLTDEVADEHADKNEKREVRREKRNMKPFSPIGNDATNDAQNDVMNDVKNDATNDTRNDVRRDASEATKGQAMTPGDANDTGDANRDARTSQRRFRIVTGEDAHFIDVDSGRRVPGLQAREMLDSGAAIEVNQ